MFKRLVFVLSIIVFIIVGSLVFREFFDFPLWGAILLSMLVFGIFSVCLMLLYGFWTCWLSGFIFWIVTGVWNNISDLSGYKSWLRLIRFGYRSKRCPRDDVSIYKCTYKYLMNDRII